MKFFVELKERLLCLFGVHGFANVKAVELKRCSYCGCHFEGYTKE